MRCLDVRPGCTLFITSMLIAVTLGAAGATRAGETPEDEGRPELVTRTFRVDEFFRTLDWGAKNAGLPDVLEPTDRKPYAVAAGGAGAFGELFGAGHARQGGTFSPTEIMELIQRFINNQDDPGVAAWPDEGGPTQIQFIAQGNASLFLVRQTEHGLKRVEVFLRDLRDGLVTGGAMLTVHARWMAVEDDKVEALIGPGPKRTVPTVVDAKAIEAAGGRVLYRGATTTFNRMQAFVAAGDLQSYVADVEPMVCGAMIGTEAVVKSLLVGALVEVRPLLEEGGKTVLLDYVSYVNHDGGSTPGPRMPMMRPTKSKNDLDVRIDHAHVACHTLRGSVRIPLDQAVLLGLTTGPDLKEDTVYALVVEVSADETAGKR